jgi:Spy/CpxP family protein refolding chaperone
MKSRFALLTGALLLFGGSPAFAQGPGGPGGFAQRRMERLLQGITLTAQQKAQLDSITAKYDSMRPAFTPGAPPDSATRAKFREVNQQEDTAIRAILTADQQKVWDANVEQMRSRMRRPGGGGGRGGR